MSCAACPEALAGGVVASSGGAPAAAADLLVIATTIAVTDATPADLFAGQLAPEPATVEAPAGLTRGGLQWFVSGTYLNNSGANRTIDITVVFGGVTIYSDTSQLIGSNATPRVWNCRGHVTRKSATAAWLGFQLFGNNGTTTGAAIGLGLLDSVGTGLSPSMVLCGGAADTGALNWSVPQRLELRVSWSAAVANLSFQIAGGRVALFGS